MLKKRFLPVILLTFCLLTQSSAWAISIAKLERKVTAAEQSHQPRSTTPKEKSTRATSTKQGLTLNTNTNTWYNDKDVISWQQFEQENEKIIQKKERFFQLVNSVPMSDTERENLSIKKGLPKYADLAKNVRYIYIGETHAEPHVQREIEKLLKAIRHNNKDAKILLATEFLCVPHPLVNPLHPVSYVEDYTFIDNLYNVKELAEKLQMDTLALDDEISQFEQDGTTLIKMGDRYVRMDEAFATDIYKAYQTEIQQSTDSSFNARLLPFFYTRFMLSPKDAYDNYAFYTTQLPQEWADIRKTSVPGNEFLVAGEKLVPGNALFAASYRDTEFVFSREKIDPAQQKELLAHVSLSEIVRYQILISEWGVKQRNVQWKKRIQEYEKPYDIVIVWAGSEHIDPVYFDSIPWLLSSSNAISFSFEPLKSHMKKEDIQSYEKMCETSNQYCLSTDASVELTEDEESQILSDCQTINFDKEFHILTEPFEEEDTPTDKKILNLLGLEKYPTMPSKMINVFVK